MGKKYIIEKDDNESIWSIYADADGDTTIEGVSLTPYTAPDLEQVRKEAYEQGRKDGRIEGQAEVWGVARKIASDDAGQNHVIFGQHFANVIFNTFTASEAIEKIRQYEQRQEEQIQVGDEVINRNKTAVVTEITDRYVRIMYSDGSGYALFSEKMVKTGRNFPEIAAVLEKMRGEQDG